MPRLLTTCVLFTSFLGCAATYEDGQDDLPSSYEAVKRLMEMQQDQTDFVREAREDQRKQALRAKETWEQFAGGTLPRTAQSEPNSEELELIKQHNQTLPAAVPGMPAVCESLCQRYAQHALQDELVCADHHRMRVSKNGQLTPMEHAQKWESYEIGASSQDPVAFLKGEALECATRGIACEQRYSTNPTNIRTADRIRHADSSPTKIVSSISDSYCQAAAKECVRVKREIACCTQDRYDECYAVCIYKGCNEYTELERILEQTPRDMVNYIDGIDGLHKIYQGPTSAVCKKEVEAAMQKYEVVEDRDNDWFAKPGGQGWEDQDEHRFEHDDDDVQEHDWTNDPPEYEPDRLGGGEL